MLRTSHGVLGRCRGWRGRSYRALSFGLGLVAAIVIIVNDAIDPGADTIDVQLRLLTASAFAAIWALPALPSVLLAWTMRDENPDGDD